MNNTVFNPFTITHPTAVQASLYSKASFARFDPTGRYIAAGRLDGTAVIWDLDTKAPIRVLEGHSSRVTSIDWSSNSRYILTSSKDWNVVVFDLAEQSDPVQRLFTFRFDASVVSASFHPRNSRIILVLLSHGEAYLVDNRTNHRGRVELCEAQDDPTKPRSAMTVARFDPSGKHIFIGTSLGSILVFNTRTKAMVARHKIPAALSLKHIDFCLSSRRLVTNSADRTLRQFTLPPYPSPGPEGSVIETELEPTHRFNDPITKTAWLAMAYSPDGEWLAGGAADAATHKIYVWDVSNDGQLSSTLDGGREPLIHLHWHPTKSMIASTTNVGNILLWHCPTPERWGAFAGGFEEIDENVEYEEREDEFDIEDTHTLALRKRRAEEHEVDVYTLDAGGVQGGYRKTVWEGEGDDDEDRRWADEEGDADEVWEIEIRIEEDNQGNI